MIVISPSRRRQSTRCVHDISVGSRVLTSARFPFAQILTRVFGITANKYKGRKDPPPRSSVTSKADAVHANLDYPDDLIRNCFFRGRPGSRVSATVHKHHRDRLRKTGSKDAGPRRSSTLPSTSTSVGDSSTGHTRDGHADAVSSTHAPGLHIRPKAPRVDTEPTTLPSARPRLDPHAHSEPHQPVTLAPATSLPGALVLSGLEHALLPAQRALLQVVHEQRIVLDADGSDHWSGSGTWKLPQDFIIVYVCPLNAYERPPVLRTLLDRFGMSVDVNVTTAVRQTYTAYQAATSPLSSSFSSLTPRTPHSPLFPLDAASQTPRTPLRPTAHLLPPPPVIPPTELAYLRSLTHPVPATIRQSGITHPADAYTHMHPTLRIYLQDLFAAARHHPLIDGSLLTLRAHRDAEDLVRAFRVVCGDSLGADLISAVAATPAPPRSEDTASLVSPSDDDSGLGWEKPEEEWLGAEIEMAGPFDGLSEGGSSRADLLAALPPQPAVWDVSEVDVGKIFPRVVSHRLRIRAGPDDEILGSVMFPAAQAEEGPASDRFRGPEDKTVKQVIVGILADV
ncbi:hypothetical protein BDW22DRAFT_554772 [Trametopsis cervina]|nr:hypothetical protein BDW22DRAFT_554772 [Trametopsis cervina]